MKIIYCINAVYNSGGMERILMNKANYLADILGYEVCIVTTEQKGRPRFFPFSSKICFVDLDINYDNDRNRSLLIRLLLKNLKMIVHRKRLERLLREKTPDICISMFDRDMGFLYKIKDGSKKILEYHFSKNVKLIEARNGLFRFFQRLRVCNWKRIVQKYDRFVVLTNEDRNAWGNIRNICVIPNFLTELPEKVSLLEEKRVISVGRLSYQKGFDYLLKSWVLVHLSCPAWKLYIFGDGDKKEDLIQQIGKYGLSDCVALMPPTANVADEYLHSSLYAMCSRYEGLPMVLLEAMSFGLPVVSFMCPCGPSDVMDNSCGSLVPLGDVETFARELIEWMKNDEKRKSAGKRSREIVKQYLKPEIMKQWEKLFCSLVNA